MNTDNQFENKMSRLQEIVTALEAGELSLDESMNLYREGMACSKFCKEHLEKAKHELTLWENGQESQLELVSDNQNEETAKKQ